jgi:uncharacterized glyoxalase superfamily protein PhnB
MPDRVVPMIHVPDVRTTVEWYQSIGFQVVETFGDGRGGLSFAIVSFGSSQVMFNEDGHSSTAARREVDLYVYTESVDDLHRRLADRVEIVEHPHDTFYGMRELIIRDLNRFWITFGQAGASNLATDSVRAGDTDAVPPPEVDVETLHAYAGEYEGEQGLKARVIVKNKKLFVALAGQPPLRLVAVDKTTFRPVALDGTITFNVEAAKATGLSYTQGSTRIQLRLVEGRKRTGGLRTQRRDGPPDPRKASPRRRT